MLKRITIEIMAGARVSDFTYRYGGEEFVVIADGVAGDEAVALGERIRRRIAGAPSDDPAGKVTASIGVATCANDASGYDKLFEIADKRLYQAKAAGRNRVIGERQANGESSVRLVKG
jgi:diguanylate cyclase (GGDEF)-like protein